MKHDATYSPEDNKLRLYPAARLDQEEYERVKKAGFIWAPKQNIFVAPMWTPGREDLLLEFCDEIEDEDKSLVDRAEERAERFEEYSDKRGADADRARAAVDRITEHIPLGQPILVGHHSERRARKDAQKIENGMRHAVRMWETSEYWKYRAAGAIRAAKYKERPDVRARRIKGLEADKRKQERYKAEAEKWLKLWNKEGLTLEEARHLANYCHLGVAAKGDQPFYYSAYDVLQPDGERWQQCPAITVEEVQEIARQRYPENIAHYTRWIQHIENRLIYERAMLAEAGGTATDQKKPEKGGACKCWASPRGGFSYIQKVNRISVTVSDNWGNGGRSFNRIMPFDKIFNVMTAPEVEDARARGLIVECFDQTGFYLKTDPGEKLEPADTKFLDPVRERIDAAPGAENKTTSNKKGEFEAMKETLKAGVQVVTAPQLYPTPPEIAARMVELAEIKEGQRILEPSAGTGQILGMILHGDVEVNAVAVELNQNCINMLRAQQQAGAYPGAEIIQDDFLSCNGNIGKFDKIIMNPPFENAIDIKHIEHARAMLRPGGRLVALCANGPRQQRAFKDIAEYWEELPAGSFKAAGTGVNVALMVLVNQENEEPAAIEYEKMTKEEAGRLDPDNARPMVGPWWFGCEGTDKLKSEEGRQAIHRTYLRNKYNGNAGPIPLNVLKSHALEEPAFNSTCWFSRAVWERENKIMENSHKNDIQKTTEEDPGREEKSCQKSQQLSFALIAAPISQPEPQPQSLGARAAEPKQSAKPQRQETTAAKADGPKRKRARIMPKIIAINATMPEKIFAQILAGNRTMISHKKNSRINKYFADKTPTVARIRAKGGAFTAFDIARIEETPDAWNIHIKATAESNKKAA